MHLGSLADSMGNRLTISAPIEDPSGPPESTTEFFKHVRTKWLEHFVSEVKTRQGKPSTETLDLTDNSLFLQWKDYFAIFSLMQEKVVLALSNSVSVRKYTYQCTCWHETTRLSSCGPISVLCFPTFSSIPLSFVLRKQSMHLSVVLFVFLTHRFVFHFRTLLRMILD